MLSRRATAKVAGFLISLIIITIANGQGYGTIRLWRSGSTLPTFSSGRVQIFWNRWWGNICDDNQFSITEATVICHQLGFTAASGHSRSANDRFGEDFIHTVLSNVDCSTESYLMILQCAYRTNPGYRCSFDNDVSVICLTTRLWEVPFSGMVRLTQGEYTSEGLVEVYCNGQWGTICDNGFNDDDANTICKQLGYSNAHRYNHLNLKGNVSQPIWYSGLSISCSRSDNCIIGCQVCPQRRITSCTHMEDITVSCVSSKPNVLLSSCQNVSSIPTTDSIGNGTVKLWRSGSVSQSISSGVVQVYINHTWGNVCVDSSSSKTEADVICRQLSYTGASKFGPTNSYGSDSYKITISKVHCATDYLVILQCSYSTALDSTCTNSINELTLACYTKHVWENPYNGMVRLISGRYVSEGLVEVFCNGQWGTVCNDGFGSDDADTICKQLGYTAHIRYNQLSSLIGATNQPLWLTNLQCKLSDSCIRQCQNCPPTQVIGCDHSDDVTLSCTFSLNEDNDEDINDERQNCQTLEELSDSAIAGITITVMIGLIILCCCCVFLSLIYLLKPCKKTPQTDTSSVLDDVISNQNTAVTLMPEEETEIAHMNSELVDPPPPQFDTESQYKTLKSDVMKREESLPTYDSLFTNNQYSNKSALKPEPIIQSAKYQPPDELPPLPHAVELPPITKKQQDSDP